MVIHISRSRFQSILDQSYRVPPTLSDDPHLRVERPDEVTDYHLLASEKEQCPICGQMECSVSANSPADLEILKSALRVADDVHT
jgi:hypothetical protein